MSFLAQMRVQKQCGNHTHATFIEPCVPLHQRGEPGDSAHRFVGIVLTDGMATGDPLLFRLHDHPVVVGGFSTTARECCPIAAAGTVAYETGERPINR